MPIYEFHCNDCRKDSEVLVQSTNWKGTKCPYCGSTKLEKKLSLFASGTGDGGDSSYPCGSGPGSSCCSCSLGSDGCR
ncbi:MAG: zinc ribbon domain-containing protein [Verrucomicrobia bacterium]|nr:zinc ribbon domain-containing protein [Verrucomicrobiota bacterium]